MTAEPDLIEMTMPAPAAVVWQAFRDPAVVRQWHGWQYEGLDDEIRCIFSEGTVASEAERTLHIGGHLFSLEDGGTRTVVRVTRAGPVEPVSGPDGAELPDEIEEGWLSFLQQLRFLLARHPSGARRTIFRSVDTRGSDATTVAGLLGLGGVAGLVPGERYSATVATGEQLAGELWFRSPRQLAVTVDAWGDGLLLLAGAGSVTLSTYGLDEATFALLEERWDRWWSRSFLQDYD